MRWLRIRTGNIDPALRETFERYGTTTMQMLLATNQTTYRHQGNIITVERYLDPLLSWLTEQYDRVERRETWLITMEAAITVFVVVEAVLSLFSFFGKHHF